MHTSTKPTATIAIHRSHWGTLEPVVPEIRDLLRRLTLESKAEGPLGHTTKPVWSSDFSGVQSRLGYIVPGQIVGPVEYQIIPVGRVDEVAGVLEMLGYELTLTDERSDSPRWQRDAKWRSHVTPELRKVVAAVHEHRALRVVAGNRNTIEMTVVALARSYPTAKIAVALPTYQSAKKFWNSLRLRFKGESIGLYTAKTKRHGRVAVGAIGQIPCGKLGSWDLLVLPNAAQTVGDAALRIATSGHFARILSITPCHWTRDANLNQRLMVVAEDVHPPEQPKVPITAVMLASPGTEERGLCRNPIVQLQNLISHNEERNRHVASIATACLSKSRKQVLALFGGQEELAQDVWTLAKSGVAILVETPKHARELSVLLPGWTVMTAWKSDDPPLPEPNTGCGIIATALGAQETVLSAGVMIRATGGPWPLPEINWPWHGDVDHGVLIDFTDEDHPIAAKNAEARQASYQRHGMTVWHPQDTPVAPKKTVGTVNRGK